MLLATLSYLFAGTVLIWISAQRLETYSVATARFYGISPFLIGATVIAFATSAPEMLTSFFAARENKGSMVVGNVIGSNVANIALVFGLTLGILSFKKETIFTPKNIKPNLLILILSSFLICLIVANRPFSIFSSLVLLCFFVGVIFYWYKRKEVINVEKNVNEEKFLLFKLIFTLLILILAAWFITKGALGVLEKWELEELFVGYTVLAIGTSLPEIAASIALALKGRHETVAGTIIGSNIFNSLLVLAIPGFFNRELEMATSWDFMVWRPLLLVLLLVTTLFCTYIFSLINKQKQGSLLLVFIFLSCYLASLALAYK